MLQVLEQEMLERFMLVFPRLFFPPVCNRRTIFLRQQNYFQHCFLSYSVISGLVEITFDASFSHCGSFLKEHDVRQQASGICVPNWRRIRLRFPPPPPGALCLAHILCKLL